MTSVEEIAGYGGPGGVLKIVLPIFHPLIGRPIPLDESSLLLLSNHLKI